MAKRTDHRASARTALGIRSDRRFSWARFRHPVNCTT
jgi:hypothetical protein